MTINSRFLATILMPVMVLFASFASAQSLDGNNIDNPTATSSSDVVASKGTTAKPAVAEKDGKIAVEAHATAPKRVTGSAVSSGTTYVNGYGNYCSKTWPATGGSVFGYVSNGGDPCKSIDPGNTGKLQRKGLYSSTSWNNVVLRCDQGLWFWTGVGNAPLDWAYQTAYTGQGKSNCVFTVAPREIPVFHAPFNGSTPAGSGFDFARSPYNTLNVTLYGQPGSTTATIVDYKGRDKSGPTYINDHAGHDWGIPKGTLLKAVADGVVERAETYIKNDGACQAVERHVYIKHKVCGSNGYCEEFMSYYTHMDSVSVNTGDIVNRDDTIGTSGDSGCVPAHLHYTLARLTNTASSLKENLTFTDQGSFFGTKINVWSNVYDWATDPYGWEPLNGPDPWGWKGYPKGVMSIKVWAPGFAPALGNW